jgi:hypothetical protein
MLLEVGPQGILLQKPLKSVLYGLSKVLDQCILYPASLELLLEPIEVDLTYVVGSQLLGDWTSPNLNRLVYHLLELPHDVSDVSLFSVLLEAFVDDVYGIPISPVGIYALDIDAGFELLENLPAQNLETLAGLVILVGCLLARHDGRIAFETGLLDDIIQ